MRGFLANERISFELFRSAWQLRPPMNLPFTTAQFFEVFRLYNVSVWPAQVALLALALAGVGLLVVNTPYRDRIISAILALLWVWMAVMYHAVYFTGINPAAWGFAAVFLLQSGLLAWFGVIKQRLRFTPAMTLNCVFGGLLLFFALLIYPALSYLLGHAWPAMPTFGLPCPTTIYTLGLLLMLKPPLPKSVFVIPLLWTAVGSTAAFQLGVHQDLGLLVAGILGIIGTFPLAKSKNGIRDI